MFGGMENVDKGKGIEKWRPCVYDKARIDVRLTKFF